MAYGTPGRFHRGIWLVVKGQNTLLVPRGHLPPVGQGWSYYWLGASSSQASGRLFDALGKLNAQDPQGAAWTGRSFDNQISQALRGQPVSIGGKSIGFLQKVLNAAGSSGVPSPGAVGTAVGGGLGGAGATAGGAAADTAGGTAAGAAGGGFAGNVAGSITDAVAFMALIAWIFHPRTLLRAVEFVTGIALMAFGIHAAIQGRGEAIEGFTTSEGALTRSGLGRVIRALGNEERSVRRAPHKEKREAPRRREARQERHLKAKESREARLKEQQRKRLKGRPGSGAY